MLLLSLLKFLRGMSSFPSNFEMGTKTLIIGPYDYNKELEDQQIEVYLWSENRRGRREDRQIGRSADRKSEVRCVVRNCTSDRKIKVAFTVRK